MSEMAVVKHYREMFSAMGGSLTENDEMVMQGVVKLTVNKKPIKLPTDEVLGAGSDGSFLIFHPLCENPNLQPSPIYKKLANSIVAIKARTDAKVLMETFAAIFTDDELVKKIPVKEKEAKKISANFNKSSAKMVIEIIRKAYNSETLPIYSFPLRYNVKVGDTINLRAMTVMSPALEEVMTKDNPYGVKCSKNGIKAVRELFSWFIPHNDKFEVCTVHHRLNIAPNYTTLLKAFEIINRNHDDLYRRFSKFLEGLYEPAETDFLADIDNFQKLRGQLPNFLGNDGPLNSNSAEDAKVAPVTLTVESETTQQKPTEKEENILDSLTGPTESLSTYNNTTSGNTNGGNQGSGMGVSDWLNKAAGPGTFGMMNQYPNGVPAPMSNNFSDAFGSFQQQQEARQMQELQMARMAQMSGFNNNVGGWGANNGWGNNQPANGWNNMPVSF